LSLARAYSRGAGLLDPLLYQLRASVRHCWAGCKGGDKPSGLAV
jgi:hypothetical protein